MNMNKILITINRRIPNELIDEAPSVVVVKVDVSGLGSIVDVSGVDGVVFSVNSVVEVASSVTVVISSDTVVVWIVPPSQLLKQCSNLSRTI